MAGAEGAAPGRSPSFCARNGPSTVGACIPVYSTGRGQAARAWTSSASPIPPATACCGPRPGVDRCAWDYPADWIEDGSLLRVKAAEEYTAGLLSTSQCPCWRGGSSSSRLRNGTRSRSSNSGLRALAVCLTS